jgi:hypothetical protein
MHVRLSLLLNQAPHLQSVQLPCPLLLLLRSGTHPPANDSGSSNMRLHVPGCWRQQQQHQWQVVDVADRRHQTQLSNPTSCCCS